MNEVERIKAVKAMEFIVRQLNDEDLFMCWLSGGVADGDIRYGDLTPSKEDEDDLEGYFGEDNDFSDLMSRFLWLMWSAYDDGSGLYCDDVCSERHSDTWVSCGRMFDLFTTSLRDTYGCFGKDREQMLEYLRKTLRMTEREISFFGFEPLLEDEKYAACNPD